MRVNEATIPSKNIRVDDVPVKSTTNITKIMKK
jgi:hypothetical protein